jgi:hypothetical protein
VPSSSLLLCLTVALRGLLNRDRLGLRLIGLGEFLLLGLVLGLGWFLLRLGLGLGGLVLLGLVLGLGWSLLRLGLGLGGLVLLLGGALPGLLRLCRG